MNFISGTIGHVAHGKSTVVKALSGVQVTFIAFIALAIRHRALKSSSVCFSL